MIGSCGAATVLFSFRAAADDTSLWEEATEIFVAATLWPALLSTLSTLFELVIIVGSVLETAGAEQGEGEGDGEGEGEGEELVASAGGACLT